MTHKVLGEFEPRLVGNQCPRFVRVPIDLSGDPPVTLTVEDRTTGAIKVASAPCITSVVVPGYESQLTWYPEAVDVDTPGDYAVTFNVVHAGIPCPFGYVLLPIIARGAPLN